MLGSTFSEAASDCAGGEEAAADADEDEEVTAAGVAAAEPAAEVEGKYNELLLL